VVCALGVLAGALFLPACGVLLGSNDDPPLAAGDASAGADASSSAAEGSVGIDADADASTRSYRDEVISDGPLVYYRFEEPDNAAPAKDEMGNHAAAYTEGTLMVVTGLAGGGRARAFKPGARIGPASSHADLQLAGTSPMTLEAWIAPDTEPDLEANIVSCFQGTTSTGSGYRMSLQKEIHFRRAGASQQAGILTPPGLLFAPTEPHHVVAVFDGNLMLLYVDSVEVKRGISTLASVGAGDPLNIGGNEDVEGFSGVIDEVAVYGKALPPDRVRAHYDARDR
jgi:hypothetical protein